jgi:hypothetical protein
MGITRQVQRNALKRQYKKYVSTYKEARRVREDGIAKKRQEAALLMEQTPGKAQTIIDELAEQDKHTVARCLTFNEWNAQMKRVVKISKQRAAIERKEKENARTPTDLTWEET